ncbi:hypothetical protein ACIQZO_40135 [Streptomyces sp. NPDC097617]|uniref:hypothetical protein n=1 Tax=Streptomyces sp. NPDC097617 TaxID=3366091 RepID=UPI0037F8A31E
MPHNLSKGASTPPSAPQTFKGYLATVTLHAGHAEIKRKLAGKLTGAKDSVISLADVIKVISKPPTRLVNGYVQLATSADQGQLVVATAEREKAIVNNSRTVLFTWSQRETYERYFDAATTGVRQQGGNPLG